MMFNQLYISISSSEKAMSDHPNLCTLPNGLILRHATPADANELATFNSRIHSDDGPDQPDRYVEAWTRDLLTRPHPTFVPGDFTVVVEPTHGRIISSMCLISQVWTYAGLPFKVGRPELVGTAPEYRGQGLVRTQFEVIHGWSRERGELAQVITGIPYYYRQYGYEMALDLGGGRIGYPLQVIPLAEGESESFVYRPAAEADIPLLMELNAQEAHRSLVYCPKDEALWRYELSGKSAENVNRDAFFIITRAADGEAVGCLSLPVLPYKTMMVLRCLELKHGIPVSLVLPGLIRFLWKAGEGLTRDRKDGLKSFGFWLGGEHPVYAAVQDRLPTVRDPYAYYVRVPDLAAFVRAVAPALESRLTVSPFSGYSGEVNINFYREGLRMLFQEGRLTQAENIRPEYWDKGDAGFPDRTFLQMLFGRRSLAELRSFFPDVWVKNDTAEGILNTLFPRAYSHLTGIS